MEFQPNNETVASGIPDAPSMRCFGASSMRKLLCNLLIIALGISLGDRLAFAQSSSLDSAKTVYRHSVESAKNKRKLNMDKVEENYQQEMTMANSKIKSAYEFSIREAALRNNTELAAKFIKELDELDLLEPKPKEINSIPVGKWVYERYGRRNMFEFKASGKVTHTYIRPYMQYVETPGKPRTMQNAESQEMEEFTVQKKEGMLILQPTSQSTMMPPNRFMSYYEVPLPFNANELKIILISQRSQNSEFREYIHLSPKN